MDPIIMTKPMVGIAHMQVCANRDVLDEELLVYANRVNPSGTEFGWTTVLREKDPNRPDSIPVTCSDDPERVHYLISC